MGILLGAQQALGLGILLGAQQALGLGILLVAQQALVWVFCWELSRHLVWVWLPGSGDSTNLRTWEEERFLSAGLLSSEILSLLLRRLILECQPHTNFSWKGGKLNGKFLNMTRKQYSPRSSKINTRWSQISIFSNKFYKILHY